jgi:hypothetical protein
MVRILCIESTILDKCICRACVVRAENASRRAIKTFTVVFVGGRDHPHIAAAGVQLDAKALRCTDRDVNLIKETFICQRR